MTDELSLENTVADIQRRIYGARSELVKSNIPMDQFTIHLSRDLWRFLTWRYGPSIGGRIKLFGMDAIENTRLADDQIRLRVEVVA